MLWVPNVVTAGHQLDPSTAGTSSLEMLATLLNGDLPHQFDTTLTGNIPSDGT
jgi:hypothetical protein